MRRNRVAREYHVSAGIIVARAGRHICRAVRTGRNRPRPLPRSLRHGIRGLGLEAPRPALSGRQVEALDQVEEPEASGDQPGDGGIRMTHDHLWVGVHLKIEAARTSLEEMRKALRPPLPTAQSVVQESTGTIVGGPDWQKTFYPLV